MRVGVTPLFETVDNMKRAPGVLRGLLEDPMYRFFLARRGATCRRSCSVTATRVRTQDT